MLVDPCASVFDCYALFVQPISHTHRRGTEIILSSVKLIATAALTSRNKLEFGEHLFARVKDRLTVDLTIKPTTTLLEPCRSGDSNSPLGTTLLDHFREQVSIAQRALFPIRTLTSDRILHRSGRHFAKQGDW